MARTRIRPPTGSAGRSSCITWRCPPRKSPSTTPNRSTGTAGWCCGATPPAAAPAGPRTTPWCTDTESTRIQGGHLMSTATLANRKAEYDQLGFWIERGLIPGAEIDRINDTFMTMHAQGGVKGFYEPQPEGTN